MRTLSILLLLIYSQQSISQNKNKIKDMLSDYSFTSKSLKIDDLNLNYIKEGNGKTTLLFLHGLSSNADAWSKNIQILKKDYTCVAIDLPGFGKSTIKSKKYTPSYFAEITNKVINQLKLENIILIGHSMGGQASIKYSLLHPDKINKLILIAPAGIEEFTPQESTLMKSAYTKQVVLNTSDEQIEKNYALNFYEIPKDSRKMIEDRKRIKKASNFDSYAEAIVQSISGMLDDPVSKELKNIKHPTLIIFGENDLLIPNRFFHSNLTTKDIASIGETEIPKAVVKYIPKSGHFVQFENPNAVNKLIKQFIEQ